MKPLIEQFICLKIVLREYYVWFKYFPKQLNEMLPKTANNYFSHLVEDAMVKYRPQKSTAMVTNRAFKGLESHSLPFLRLGSVVLLMISIWSL